MGRTRQFFTFIFFTFVPQSIAEILMIPLLKTNGCHVGILLLISICTLYQQRVILRQQQQHITTTRKPHFIQFAPPTPELWRHMACSSWRQPHPKLTSGFRFADVLDLWRSKTIFIPNLDRMSQSAVFENIGPPYWNSPTFDLWAFRRLILQRPTKFYANWTISDRVMTSQIYFRFPVLWRLTL